MKKVEVLKSKIHTVIVTDASVDYEGSITIDEEILEAADIHKYEFVHINCKTNGERITTYVIPGKRGSGVVAINGAAAKKVFKGDTIHILSFCSIDLADIHSHTPTVVFTENNRVKMVEEYV